MLNTINKEYKRSTFILMLVLFVSQAIPGIYVRGILVNVCDVAITMLFVYTLLKKRAASRIFSNFFVLLTLFGIAAVLSVLVASIQERKLYVIAMLRTARLFLAPMLIYTIKTWREEVELKPIFLSCVLGGIVSGIFAIIMYWIQYPPYCAVQTLVKDGQMIYRAGGIQHNSSAFGAQMALLFALCTWGWLNTEHRKQKILFGMGILVSIAGVLCSFGRTPWIAMGLAVLFLIIRYRNREAASLILVCTICFATVFAVNSLGGSAQLMRQRMEIPAGSQQQGSEQKVTQEEIDTYSSGRVSQLLCRVEQYMGNSQYYLTGSGFDIERDGLTYTCDCQYATSLVSMGVVGFASMMALYLYWLFVLVKTRKEDTRTWSLCFVTGIWHAITALTADALCFSISTVAMAYVLVWFEEDAI